MGNGGDTNSVNITGTNFDKAPKYIFATVDDNGRTRWFKLDDIRKVEYGNIGDWQLKQINYYEQDNNMKGFRYNNNWDSSPFDGGTNTNSMNSYGTSGKNTVSAVKSITAPNDFYTTPFQKTTIGNITVPSYLWKDVSGSDFVWKLFQKKNKNDYCINRPTDNICKVEYENKCKNPDYRFSTNDYNCNKYCANKSVNEGKCNTGALEYCAQTGKATTNECKNFYSSYCSNQENFNNSEVCRSWCKNPTISQGVCDTVATKYCSDNLNTNNNSINSYCACFDDNAVKKLSILEQNLLFGNNGIKNSNNPAHCWSKDCRGSSYKTNNMDPDSCPACFQVAVNNSIEARNIANSVIDASTTQTCTVDKKTTVQNTNAEQSSAPQNYSQEQPSEQNYSQTPQASRNHSLTQQEKDYKLYDTLPLTDKISYHIKYKTNTFYNFILVIIIIIVLIITNSNNNNSYNIPPQFNSYIDRRPQRRQLQEYYQPPINY